MIKKRIEDISKPKVAAIVIRDGKEIHMTEEEYERYKKDDDRVTVSLEDFMEELGNE